MPVKLAYSGEIPGPTFLGYPEQIRTVPRDEAADFFHNRFGESENYVEQIAAFHQDNESDAMIPVPVKSHPNLGFGSEVSQEVLASLSDETRAAAAARGGVDVDDLASKLAEIDAVTVTIRELTPSGGGAITEREVFLIID